MEDSNVHSFLINKQITSFHIPENGVIINGLPEIEHEPVLSEEEILRSKIVLLEAEIQKTREESYQEGFNACKRSMEDQHSEELESQKEMLLALKTNLESEVKEALANIYHPILEISKNVASKIIEEELDSTQKWISTVKSKIEKYGSKLSEQTTLTVNVNPNCIHYLQSGEFNCEKIDSNLINFIADDSLKFGECIIESDNQIIDATFQNQIDHIINNIS